MPFAKPVAVYAVVVEPVLAINVVHVFPPLELTSTKYPETAFPPVDDGATQASATCPSDAVAVSERGAVAVPDGVADASVDAVPTPAELIALTRKRYASPFVKPETTKTVEAEPVFATREDHVVPPFVDCSTL